MVERLWIDRGFCILVVLVVLAVEVEAGVENVEK